MWSRARYIATDGEGLVVSRTQENLDDVIIVVSTRGAGSGARY